MVEEITEKQATLTWSPPLSDGGSEITDYVIQKKDRFSPRFSDAGEVPGDETKFTVKGLKEGDEYEFRIVPKNKAGEGKPSVPVSVKAVAPFSKFRHLWTAVSIDLIKFSI